MGSWEIFIWSQNCHSFPFLSYLFDEEDADTKTKTTEVEADVKPVEEPPKPAVVAEKKKPPRSADVDNVKSTTSVNKKNKSSRKRKAEANVNPPVGLFANMMKLGASSLRSVVETGTELGTSTIDQAARLNNAVIDQTQNVVQAGTQKSLNTVVPLVGQADKYRRMLSGGTKANADKGHSFTITTSSDTPINTVYDFMQEYMPAGAASKSSPTITGMDFSEFFRRWNKDF